MYALIGLAIVAGSLGAADSRDATSSTPPSSRKGSPAPAPNRPVESDDAPQPVRFETIVVDHRPKPTLGGLQFWADRHLFRDWRIQQNVLTSHCRLLDGADRRHASGTERVCVAFLERVKRDKGLEPRGGKAVILLQGTSRTRHCMEPLARHLESEGFTAYTVSYASTRLTIEQHAENLGKIVSALTDAEEIHFVGHSMGGLVIRAYLANDPDDRIGRVVMMGTPNQGARKADAWHDNWGYKLVMGPSGQQLGTDAGGVTHSLPTTLTAEFGILAGGKGNQRGYSRRLPGDDDGTVTVESARLAGAADFRVVPIRHTFLMRAPTVRAHCTAFLKEGRFGAEEDRQPIPHPPKPESQAAAQR